MDRSIYTALNSMSILRDNQSVTSQNLANVSVPGFQKDVQINKQNTKLMSKLLEIQKGKFLGVPNVIRSPPS